MISIKMSEGMIIATIAFRYNTAAWLGWIGIFYYGI